MQMYVSTHWRLRPFFVATPTRVTSSLVPDYAGAWHEGPVEEGYWVRRGKDGEGGGSHEGVEQI